jgi:prefoldin subunit 5
MFYTIYKITNKINGKSYIGKHQTKKLDDDYMGSGTLVRKAIKKYGVQNFEKEILHIFSNEADMNEAEKTLVTLGENSYNLCPGGQGGFGYINENGLNNSKKDFVAMGPEISIRTKSQRRREFNRDPVAEYEKMLKKSQQGVEAIKTKYPEGVWKGRKHHPETKLKMSEQGKKRKGELNSQFGTCWVTNGYQNVKIPKEKLDEYVVRGYTRGRNIYHRNAE